MAKAAQLPIDSVDEATVETIPLQKRNRRKLILLAIAVLALLGGGGTAAWYFLGAPPESPGARTADLRPAKAAAKGKEAARQAAKEKKPSVFLALDTFTVNLQEEGNDRYLQTTVVFEISDEKATEEIKAQMPIIRSKLLLLLSSKRPSELAALAGKEKLAEDIKAEARKRVTFKSPDSGLLEVHFNALVIQ